MIGKISLLRSVIILFLFGYFLQITFIQIAQAISIQPQAQSPSNAEISKQGQLLPITAQAQISGKIINLEVAKTPQEQALGLMYRDELPDDRGMLFSFDPPRPANFWMKNCQISLDMIFIRSGIVQAIAVNAPPCQVEPCPTYGVDVPVDQVIEVRGGLTRELNLKVGDRIVVTQK